MDPAVQRFGDLVVDLAAEPDQTAERRLDVAAGAAETIVKIEVAEGGVEVVAPHQADHAAAKPDAFRIAGGAVDRLGRFDEFVRLALAFLGGGFGGCGRLLTLLRLVLLRALLFAALGGGGGDAEQKRRGDRQSAQRHVSIAR